MTKVKRNLDFPLVWLIGTEWMFKLDQNNRMHTCTRFCWSVPYVVRVPYVVVSVSALYGASDAACAGTTLSGCRPSVLELAILT